MVNSRTSPKEGDVYKTIKVDKQEFELRYGYYEETDRDNTEPVVIYPDLSHGVYDKDGYPIVTAVQDPCPHYQETRNVIQDASCVDCIYYIPPGEDIGTCKCKYNRRVTN